LNDIFERREKQHDPTTLLGKGTDLFWKAQEIKEYRDKFAQFVSLGTPKKYTEEFKLLFQDEGNEEAVEKLATYDDFTFSAMLFLSKFVNGEVTEQNIQNFMKDLSPDDLKEFWSVFEIYIDMLFAESRCPTITQEDIDLLGMLGRLDIAYESEYTKIPYYFDNGNHEILTEDWWFTFLNDSSYQEILNVSTEDHDYLTETLVRTIAFTPFRENELEGEYNLLPDYPWNEEAMEGLELGFWSNHQDTEFLQLNQEANYENFINLRDGGLRTTFTVSYEMMIDGIGTTFIINQVGEEGIIDPLGFSIYRAGCKIMDGEFLIDDDALNNTNKIFGKLDSPLKLLPGETYELRIQRNVNPVSIITYLNEKVSMNLGNARLQDPAGDIIDLDGEILLEFHLYSEEPQGWRKLALFLGGAKQVGDDLIAFWDVSNDGLIDDNDIIPNMNGDNKTDVDDLFILLELKITSLNNRYPEWALMETFREFHISCFLLDTGNFENSQVVSREVIHSQAPCYTTFPEADEKSIPIKIYVPQYSIDVNCHDLAQRLSDILSITYENVEMISETQLISTLENGQGILIFMGGTIPSDIFVDDINRIQVFLDAGGSIVWNSPEPPFKYVTSDGELYETASYFNEEFLDHQHQDTIIIQDTFESYLGQSDFYSVYNNLIPDKLFTVVPAEEAGRDSNQGLRVKGQGGVYKDIGYFSQGVLSFNIKEVVFAPQDAVHVILKNSTSMDQHSISFVGDYLTGIHLYEGWNEFRAEFTQTSTSSSVSYYLNGNFLASHGYAGSFDQLQIKNTGATGPVTYTDGGDAYFDNLFLKTTPTDSHADSFDPMGYVYLGNDTLDSLQFEDGVSFNVGNDNYQDSLSFDLGPNIVENWTRIMTNTTYNATEGYGWVDVNATMEWYNASAPNQHLDTIALTGPSTFMVNISSSEEYRIELAIENGFALNVSDDYGDYLIEEGFYDSSKADNSAIHYIHERYLDEGLLNITIVPHGKDFVNVSYIKLTPLMRIFNFTVPPNAIDAKISTLLSPLTSNPTSMGFYLKDHVNDQWWDLSDYQTSSRNAFFEPNERIDWYITWKEEWEANYIAFENFISPEGTLQVAIAPVAGVEDSIAMDMLRVETLSMDPTLHEDMRGHFGEEKVLGQVYTKTLDEPVLMETQGTLFESVLNYEVNNPVDLRTAPENIIAWNQNLEEMVADPCTIPISQGMLTIINTGENMEDTIKLNNLLLIVDGYIANQVMNDEQLEWSETLESTLDLTEQASPTIDVLRQDLDGDDLQDISITLDEYFIQFKSNSSLLDINGLNMNLDLTVNDSHVDQVNEILEVDRTPQFVEILVFMTNITTLLGITIEVQFRIWGSGFITIEVNIDDSSTVDLQVSLPSSQVDVQIEKDDWMLLSSTSGIGVSVFSYDAIDTSQEVGNETATMRLQGCNKMILFADTFSHSVLTGTVPPYYFEEQRTGTESALGPWYSLSAQPLDLTFSSATFDKTTYFELSEQWSHEWDYQNPEQGQLSVIDAVLNNAADYGQNYLNWLSTDDYYDGEGDIKYGTLNNTDYSVTFVFGALPSDIKNMFLSYDMGINWHDYAQNFTMEIYNSTLGDYMKLLEIGEGQQNPWFSDELDLGAHFQDYIVSSEYPEDVVKIKITVPGNDNDAVLNVDQLAINVNTLFQVEQEDVASGLLSYKVQGQVRDNHSINIPLTNHPFLLFDAKVTDGDANLILNASTSTSWELVQVPMTTSEWNNERINLVDLIGDVSKNITGFGIAHSGSGHVVIDNLEFYSISSNDTAISVSDGLLNLNGEMLGLFFNGTTQEIATNIPVNTNNTNKFESKITLVGQMSVELIFTYQNNDVQAITLCTPDQELNETETCYLLESEISRIISLELERSDLDFIEIRGQGLGEATIVFEWMRFLEHDPVRIFNPFSITEHSIPFSSKAFSAVNNFIGEPSGFFQDACFVEFLGGNYTFVELTGGLTDFNFYIAGIQNPTYLELPADLYLVMVEYTTDPSEQNFFTLNYYRNDFVLEATENGTTENFIGLAAFSFNNARYETGSIEYSLNDFIIPANINPTYSLNQEFINNSVDLSFLQDPSKTISNISVMFDAKTSDVMILEEYWNDELMNEDFLNIIEVGEDMIYMNEINFLENLNYEIESEYDDEAQGNWLIYDDVNQYLELPQAEEVNFLDGYSIYNNFNNWKAGQAWWQWAGYWYHTLTDKYYYDWFYMQDTPDEFYEIIFSNPNFGGIHGWESGAERGLQSPYIELRGGSEYNDGRNIYLDGKISTRSQKKKHQCTAYASGLYPYYAIVGPYTGYTTVNTENVHAFDYNIGNYVTGAMFGPQSELDFRSSPYYGNGALYDITNDYEDGEVKLSMTENPSYVNPGLDPLNSLGVNMCDTNPLISTSPSYWFPWPFLAWDIYFYEHDMGLKIGEQLGYRNWFKRGWATAEEGIDLIERAQNAGKLPADVSQFNLEVVEIISNGVQITSPIGFPLDGGIGLQFATADDAFKPLAPEDWTTYPPGSIVNDPRQYFFPKFQFYRDMDGVISSVNEENTELKLQGLSINYKIGEFGRTDPSTMTSMTSKSSGFNLSSYLHEYEGQIIPNMTLKVVDFGEDPSISIENFKIIIEYVEESFDAAELEDAFNELCIPELSYSSLLFNAEDEFIGSYLDSDNITHCQYPVSWKSFDGNFSSMLKGLDAGNCQGYAFTSVYSEKDQVIDFQVTHDGVLKAYINGKLRYEELNSSVQVSKFPVFLRKGYSYVLLKTGILNENWHGGSWNVDLQFLNANTSEPMDLITMNKIPHHELYGESVSISSDLAELELKQVDATGRAMVSWSFDESIRDQIDRVYLELDGHMILNTTDWNQTSYSMYDAQKGTRTFNLTFIIDSEIHTLIRTIDVSIYNQGLSFNSHEINQGSFWDPSSIVTRHYIGEQSFFDESWIVNTIIYSDSLLELNALTAGDVTLQFTLQNGSLITKNWDVNEKKVSFWKLFDFKSTDDLVVLKELRVFGSETIDMHSLKISDLGLNFALNSSGDVSLSNRSITGLNSIKLGQAGAIEFNTLDKLEESLFSFSLLAPLDSDPVIEFQIDNLLSIYLMNDNITSTIVDDKFNWYLNATLNSNDFKTWIIDVQELLKRLEVEHSHFIQDWSQITKIVFRNNGTESMILDTLLSTPKKDFLIENDILFVNDTKTIKYAFLGEKLGLLLESSEINDRANELSWINDGDSEFGLINYNSTLILSQNMENEQPVLTKEPSNFSLQVELNDKINETHIFSCVSELLTPVLINNSKDQINYQIEGDITLYSDSLLYVEVIIKNEQDSWQSMDATILWDNESWTISGDLTRFDGRYIMALGLRFIDDVWNHTSLYNIEISNMTIQVSPTIELISDSFTLGLSLIRNGIYYDDNLLQDTGNIRVFESKVINNSKETIMISRKAFLFNDLRVSDLVLINISGDFSIYRDFTDLRGNILGLEELHNEYGIDLMGINGSAYESTFSHEWEDHVSIENSTIIERPEFQDIIEDFLIDLIDLIQYYINRIEDEVVLPIIFNQTFIDAYIQRFFNSSECLGDVLMDFVGDICDNLNEVFSLQNIIAFLTILWDFINDFWNLLCMYWDIIVDWWQGGGTPTQGYQNHLEFNFLDNITRQLIYTEEVNHFFKLINTPETSAAQVYIYDDVPEIYFNEEFMGKISFDEEFDIEIVSMEPLAQTPFMSRWKTTYESEYLQLEEWINVYRDGTIYITRKATWQNETQDLNVSIFNIDISEHVYDLINIDNYTFVSNVWNEGVGIELIESGTLVSPVKINDNKGIISNFSSELGAYPASNIIDGNDLTSWRPSSSGWNFIELDLDDTLLFNKVNLSLNGNSPYNLSCVLLNDENEYVYAQYGEYEDDDISISLNHAEGSKLRIYTNCSEIFETNLALIDNNINVNVNWTAVINSTIESSIKLFAGKKFNFLNSNYSFPFVSQLDNFEGLTQWDFCLPENDLDNVFEGHGSGVFLPGSSMYIPLSGQLTSFEQQGTIQTQVRSDGHVNSISGTSFNSNNGTIKLNYSNGEKLVKNIHLNNLHKLNIKLPIKNSSSSALSIILNGHKMSFSVPTNTSYTIDQEIPINWINLEGQNQVIVEGNLEIYTLLTSTSDSYIDNGTLHEINDVILECNEKIYPSYGFEFDVYNKEEEFLSQYRIANLPSFLNDGKTENLLWDYQEDWHSWNLNLYQIMNNLKFDENLSIYWSNLSFFVNDFGSGMNATLDLFRILRTTPINPLTEIAYVGTFKDDSSLSVNDVSIFQEEFNNSTYNPNLTPFGWYVDFGDWADNNDDILREVEDFTSIIYTEDERLKIKGISFNASGLHYEHKSSIGLKSLPLKRSDGTMEVSVDLMGSNNDLVYPSIIITSASDSLPSWSNQAIKVKGFGGNSGHVQVLKWDPTVNEQWDKWQLYYGSNPDYLGYYFQDQVNINFLILDDQISIYADNQFLTAFTLPSDLTDEITISLELNVPDKTQSSTLLADGIVEFDHLEINSIINEYFLKDFIASAVSPIFFGGQDVTDTYTVLGESVDFTHDEIPFDYGYDLATMSRRDGGNYLTFQSGFYSAISRKMLQEGLMNSIGNAQGDLILLNTISGYSDYQDQIIDTDIESGYRRHYVTEFYLNESGFYTYSLFTPSGAPEAALDIELNSGAQIFIDGVNVSTNFVFENALFEEQDYMKKYSKEIYLSSGFHKVLILLTEVSWQLKGIPIGVPPENNFRDNYFAFSLAAEKPVEVKSYLPHHGRTINYLYDPNYENPYGLGYYDSVLTSKLQAEYGKYHASIMTSKITQVSGVNATKRYMLQDIFTALTDVGSGNTITPYSEFEIGQLQMTTDLLFDVLAQRVHHPWEEKPEDVLSIPGDGSAMEEYLDSGANVFLSGDRPYSRILYQSNKISWANDYLSGIVKILDLIDTKSVFMDTNADQDTYLIRKKTHDDPITKTFSMGPLSDQTLSYTANSAWNGIVYINNQMPATIRNDLHAPIDINLYQGGHINCTDNINAEIINPSYFPQETGFNALPGEITSIGMGFQSIADYVNWWVYPFQYNWEFDGFGHHSSSNGWISIGSTVPGAHVSSYDTFYTLSSPIIINKPIPDLGQIARFTLDWECTGLPHFMRSNYLFISQEYYYSWIENHPIEFAMESFYYGLLEEFKFKDGMFPDGYDYEAKVKIVDMSLPQENILFNDYLSINQDGTLDFSHLIGSRNEIWLDAYHCYKISIIPTSTRSGVKIHYMADFQKISDAIQSNELDFMWKYAIPTDLKMKTRFTQGEVAPTDIGNRYLPEGLIENFQPKHAFNIGALNFIEQRICVDFYKYGNSDYGGTTLPAIVQGNRNPRSGFLGYGLSTLITESHANNSILLAIMMKDALAFGVNGFNNNVKLDVIEKIQRKVTGFDLVEWQPSMIFGLSASDLNLSLPISIDGNTDHLLEDPKDDPSLHQDMSELIIGNLLNEMAIKDLKEKGMNWNFKNNLINGEEPNGILDTFEPDVLEYAILTIPTIFGPIPIPGVQLPQLISNIHLDRMNPIPWRLFEDEFNKVIRNPSNGFGQGIIDILDESDAGLGYFDGSHEETSLYEVYYKFWIHVIGQYLATMMILETISIFEVNNLLNNIEDLEMIKENAIYDAAQELMNHYGEFPIKDVFIELVPIVYKRNPSGSWGADWYDVSYSNQYNYSYYNEDRPAWQNEFIFDYWKKGEITRFECFHKQIPNDHDAKGKSESYTDWTPWNDALKFRSPTQELMEWEVKDYSGISTRYPQLRLNEFKFNIDFSPSDLDTLVQREIDKVLVEIELYDCNGQSRNFTRSYFRHELSEVKEIGFELGGFDLWNSYELVNNDEQSSLPFVVIKINGRTLDGSYELLDYIYEAIPLEHDEEYFEAYQDKWEKLQQEQKDLIGSPEMLKMAMAQIVAGSLMIVAGAISGYIAAKKGKINKKVALSLGGTVAFGYDFIVGGIQSLINYNVAISGADDYVDFSGIQFWTNVNGILGTLIIASIEPLMPGKRAGEIDYSTVYKNFDYYSFLSGLRRKEARLINAAIGSTIDLIKFQSIFGKQTGYEVSLGGGGARTFLDTLQDIVDALKGLAIDISASIGGLTLDDLVGVVGQLFGRISLRLYKTTRMTAFFEMVNAINAITRMSVQFLRYYDYVLLEMAGYSNAMEMFHEMGAQGDAALDTLFGFALVNNLGWQNVIHYVT